MEFYSSFDFNKNIISLLEGKSEECNRVNYAVHVINPLLPTLNVSKNITSEHRDYFQHRCSESAKHLRQCDRDDDSWGLVKTLESPKRKPTSPYSANKKDSSLNKLLTGDQESESGGKAGKTNGKSVLERKMSRWWRCYRTCTWKYRGNVGCSGRHVISINQRGLFWSSCDQHGSLWQHGLFWSSQDHCGSPWQHGLFWSSHDHCGSPWQHGLFWLSHDHCGSPWQHVLFWSSHDHHGNIRSDHYMCVYYYKHALSYVTDSGDIKEVCYSVIFSICFLLLGV